MLKVGVVGATGYTGEEIVKILARHRHVRVTVLQAIVEKETPISEIFPYLLGKIDIICGKPNWKKAAKKTDLIFLALPHTVSMTAVPAFLKAGKKVVDLSADYRLESKKYETWYGTRHRDRTNIRKAVYGLPELFGNEIRKAQLLANPGCYPTACLLAMAPLLKKNLIDQHGIIIDAKSGATGAGRKAHLALSFSEVNENAKAYKINEHQHKPEIDAIATRIAGKKTETVFVPHLIPLNRGIISTIYMKLKKKSDTDRVIKLYRDFYRGEQFVNIMKAGTLPVLRDVQYTNSCNIGIKVTGDNVIAVSCIDNLLKGAAGQAVQNMNIMCGFDEGEGLI